MFTPLLCFGLCYSLQQLEPISLLMQEAPPPLFYFVKCLLCSRQGAAHMLSHWIALTTVWRWLVSLFIPILLKSKLSSEKFRNLAKVLELSVAVIGFIGKSKGLQSLSSFISFFCLTCFQLKLSLPEVGSKLVKRRGKGMNCLHSHFSRGKDSLNAHIFS